MSMIIDGTNGLTFNNATTQASAGLPLTGGTLSGALTVPTLNAPSGVLATQNGMTGIAKAWVNFAGASGTINNSFNVSSVTRTSTGFYTVNLTTAMPSTAYAVCANGSPDAATYTTVAMVFSNASEAYVAPTTSSFVMLFVRLANTAADPVAVTASVFSS